MKESEVLWFALRFLIWFDFIKFSDLLTCSLLFKFEPDFTLVAEKGGDKLNALLVRFPFSRNFSANFLTLEAESWCVFLYELIVGIMWFLFHFSLVGDYHFFFWTVKKFLILFRSKVLSCYSQRVPFLADLTGTWPRCSSEMSARSLQSSSLRIGEFSKVGLRSL